MNDLLFRLVELGSKGYCCSQILLVLGLEAREEENPSLVRAMGGLCHGMGDCEGICGVLTGAECLLALYAGKGTEDESADERLPLMRSEFREWFIETVGSRYGGIRCGDILEDASCQSPNPERCGNMVADAYTKAMKILVENGFDPSGALDD